MNALEYSDLKILESAKKIFFGLLICINLSSTAQAIIPYSGDNNTNLNSPDTPRNTIFDSVAKISNENGTGIIGSAVYVKGKYLLTAAHVLYKDETPRRSYVTFDGTSYWAIDLDFLPVQIGNADMVLFKLIDNPNLAETSLNSSTYERFKTGTLIGWGFGRNPDQADITISNRTWEWGNNATSIKRWGTNKIEATSLGTIGNYTYHYMVTQLDSDNGNDEAAFSDRDSGSGLFIYNSSNWQLAGITSAVTTFGNSAFTQSSGTQDANYFIRISQYRQTILNTIPDTSTYEGWAIDNSLYGTDAEIAADPDGDYLSNQSEFNLNTNPNLLDTDSDGLSDGEEVNNQNTDPIDSDSDDDGLSDGEEINNYNSNPLDSDSDGDEIIDGQEIYTYGTDPNNSDSDSDSLSDSSEINIHNTDPSKADSDNDGLSDGDEINIHNSNPNNSDTSNDGFSDQVLVDYGLNPNLNHSQLYDSIVQSISDLRAGSTIIEVTNNQATIILNLESSDDLLSWAETGDVATLQVSASNNNKFYRFKLSD